MLNTFFTATIIVAGVKIRSNALKILSNTPITLTALPPKELAMIRTAPDIKNGVVSLSLMLNKPTIKPKRTRTTTTL